MNTRNFLADPRRYFAGSYDAFCSFGGPCIYFHVECLRAGKEQFLSARHLEMLYATLTAWGMHRMGDAKTTKAKLTDWQRFSESILRVGNELEKYRGHRMLEMSESQYDNAIQGLKPIYQQLRVSISNATVVANSKALFHLLPEFIPPIDRQYTVRFFTQAPERWRDRKGKFQVIALPPSADGQFDLFRDICLRMKRLSAQIGPQIFAEEQRTHSVVAPKALDNAIVSYVTMVAQRSNLALEPTAPDDAA